MTTTDWIIGGAVVLIVLRHLRGTFLEQLRADRPTTRRELAQFAVEAASASATPLAAAGALLTKDGSEGTRRKQGAGWSDGTRRVVSIGTRLAFFGWLYVITEGAAFSPFAFVQDAAGGTVWQPVLVVWGVSEAVVRVAAVAVRAVTADKR